ncbi:MAG: hypothetical protein C7B43_21335 [Sulfobacillus benefaciens]|jgi:ABC-type multidrug transport system ATPase subunit|uniref:ABC transporter domain-containing protein n=1 Tax=Sulfobacillus benefaciens TaxID=453960 RepID=A0A2T2WGK1_9FIRM|nr:MAG: hypothetical protein C7B43_21335 [Sulfobacillus benefaciens]HBQ94639.1 hypothetical protein [Sulfobacillus sp.]
MVINAEQLEKTQNHRLILQDVTLPVPPNSICGIFGPHGAGKARLVRILTGIWRPSAGHLSLFGKPWTVEALKRGGVVWDRALGHESWPGLTMMSVYSRLYHGTTQQDEALFSRLGLCGQQTRGHTSLLTWNAETVSDGVSIIEGSTIAHFG